MNYSHTTSTDSITTYLVDTLKTHLSLGQHVLWLISGGSAIAIAVAVAKQLSDLDTSKLSVTLTDERYGPIGHKDENWQQLIDAGFDLPNATLLRPLTGIDRHETTQAFGRWIGEHIQNCDYSIGLFGIGSDGHTAGLKPGSSALGASGWAIDFTGVDFERTTITFNTIKRLDEAVAYAVGADKRQTIEQLLHHDITVDIQPAQILKLVQRATLFTDYKEIKL